jgi:hypothetical protein
MSFYTLADKMTSSKKKSNVDRQIDENLKRVYGDALNEDLPEKFLSLIDKLKSQERKKDAD